MLIPLKNKSARFYASAAGKITLIFLAIIFVLATVNNLYALSMSCTVKTSCPYPSAPVLYLQNDSGGFDNAHAQNNTISSLQGLVVWWRFNNFSSIGDNDSIVYDWSGNGHNGTFSGGYGSNLTLTSDGYFRGGLRLYGADSGQLSRATVGSVTNVTISLWMNVAVDNNNDLFLRYAGTGFYACTNGQYRVVDNALGIDYPGTFGSCSGASLVNSWNHFVFTKSGTNVSVYVNGVIQATNNSANAAAGSNPTIEIGNIFSGRNINGTLDDFMIFNRTLSAGDIQAIYNRRYAPYNYVVCCSSSDTTLNGACTQSIPLKLSNYTNAHVQTASYTGPGITYPVLACLSANPGRVECVYQDSACTGTYSCLGSIASSEIGDSNLTNAHIGSCNEYTKKICCKMNSPPGISNVTLNSTYGTNLTSENLTVYFNMSDADGDAFTNITDWRVNGTSIAVLNMAFNTNTSSTATGAVRDYSTHSKNGTLGAGTAANSPVWNISGKVGGAYTFDGINDYIDVGTFPTIVNGSIAAWIRREGNTSTYQMIFNDAGSKLEISYYQNQLQFYINNSGVFYNSAANFGQWYFVVGTFDSLNGRKLYVNGELVNTGSYSGIAESAYKYIGGRGTSFPFNGTIDEVQVFNRSLSAYQIAEMYRWGVNNLSVQRMHDNETEKGQNWTVALTGNDLSDGPTVLSNQVIIRNTQPTVTLTAPDNGNATTNRTPMFNWTGFDPDGDSMTYEINFTTFLDAGATSLCADIRSDTTANTYYIPTGDLLCLKDNGVYYVWSVRANDGGGYGPWSSTRTVNITALTTISLPVNTMEFGSMRINDQNDSTDDAPAPFVLQNDGNSLLHINMSATNLWQSVANPNKYYKFKVDNVTGETNAFNWSGSQTIFANTTLIESLAFHRLNYSNIKDSGEIDIYVQVPPNEPPAIRSSNATFYAYLAET